MRPIPWPRSVHDRRLYHRDADGGWTLTHLAPWGGVGAAGARPASRHAQTGGKLRRFAGHARRLPA